MEIFQQCSSKWLGIDIDIGNDIDEGINTTRGMHFCSCMVTVSSDTVTQNLHYTCYLCNKMAKKRLKLCNKG